jgi:hypothetical protein
MAREAPPEPWASWEEVRTVRAALKKGRSLLLRRPEHLDAAEAAQLQDLLDTPIGSDLRLARDFLTDWYAFWRDEEGRRRDLAEAEECCELWRANPEYARLVPLLRIQQSVDAARFRQLSHFLGQPGWEATNNRAERMGRTFRHRQGPHFNLRTTTSIERAFKVQAYQGKEAVLTPEPILENRCSRGRPSHLMGRQPALAMAA